MTYDGTFGSPDAALAAFEQSHDVLVAVDGPELAVAASNARARALIDDRPFAEAVGSAASAQCREVLDSGTPRIGERWRVRDSAGRVQSLTVDLVPWHEGRDVVRGVLVIAGYLPTGGRRGPPDDTILRIQDALLPDELPVVPGLDIAASYLLHTDDAIAGGDWFDAVVRPDGMVALAVGDVVGHGVAASAVMGQLRAVLHERLTSDATLGVVLDDLDRYARTRPESRATTLAIAEIHPGTGVFTYCTAGHPPPLLVTADSTVYLATSGAGPLATGSGHYPMCRGQLEPDDLLLLYTDGLVDRPGRTPGQNTVELAEVMSSEYADRTSTLRTSEQVCTRGLETLTVRSGHSDDLTVLAAQRVPVVEPLTLRVPAEVGSIGLVRRELDSWFDRLDVRPLDRFSVQHAVGELVTNAVEHAYPGKAGEVAVAVAAHSAGLVAQVSDRGHWLDQPAPLPARGNGLAMARGLVDHVDIATGETGTVVTARTRLTRPAQMLRARRTGVALPAGSGEPFTARDGAPGLLCLSGALDSDAADQLRARIRRAGAGGTRPLVVDLANVTHLGSAGVQALHETVAESAVPPRLHAPAGSVAQHVLELVRLPYETSPPTPQ